MAAEGSGHRSERRRKAVATALVAAAAALFVAHLALAYWDDSPSRALSGLGVVAFAVVGGLVLVHRPENRIGWLLAVCGLSMALMGAAHEYALRALVVAPGSLPGGEAAAYLTQWLPMLPVGLLFCVLPLVFPDGRLLSRRWRVPLWSAWAYIAVGTLSNALDREPVEGLPGYGNPYPLTAVVPYLGPFHLLSVLFLGVAAVSGAVVLLLRWRRAQGDERQQLRWCAAGVLPLLVPVATHEAAPGFSAAAFALLLPAVPAAIGVAALRYRLYDLDVVLNRTLVYTVLSGLAAGLYLVLAVTAEAVLGAGRTVVSQGLACVAAAAAFQPLRSRVQLAVDTLFYGDRARPYEVLSRLSRLLEQAPIPETVLPGVVETVATALRLPYVAVELREDDAWVTAAAHGASVGEPEEFPMVHQDETVGRLLVCRRGADDGFSRAELRLLADLARQAALAAHAVQLTLALQRSRASVVATREEERRRLRRDLHDGLGPALAGVILGLHAAAVHVPREPDRAIAQLTVIQGQVEEAVRDVRRLVYGLRPPALDDLGLGAALEREAARLASGGHGARGADGPDGVGGLEIAVDLPREGLGRLPAAVEAAAYRIVTEAMTNVVRHAGARRCNVRLARSGDLEVEVEVRDDGCGLGGRPAGVGLTAMRERAEELGGMCRIESPRADGGGTRVLARLPLAGLS